MTHRRGLLFAAFLALAMVLAGLLVLLPPRDAGSGGDFTLMSADGPLSLAEQRGKVVLLYFGYTYCPDVCPTSLVAIGKALSDLKPDELVRVSAWFISVDPARDTPLRLKEYAAFFHPRIVGATGTDDEIHGVARRYRVFFARQPADAFGNYSVDHTSESFVIGPDGRLVARLPHGSSSDAIVAAIRRSLANP